MIAFSAEIVKAETTADRGNKIIIRTGEMKPENRTKLFALVDSGSCYIGIDSKEMPQELKVITTQEPIKPSKSKLLRAAIFGLWTSQHRVGLFENFYHEYMDGLITEVTKKSLTSI